MCIFARVSVVGTSYLKQRRHSLSSISSKTYEKNQEWGRNNIILYTFYTCIFVVDDDCNFSTQNDFTNKIWSQFDSYFYSVIFKFSHRSWSRIRKKLDMKKFHYNSLLVIVVILLIFDSRIRSSRKIFFFSLFNFDHMDIMELWNNTYYSQLFISKMNFFNTKINTTYKLTFSKKNMKI